jgi:SAM-dependent methyltransferase
MLEYHLGGHKGRTHTDEGVLDYFWNLNCRRLIDVGCGPGGQVKLAIKKGWTAFGIDGDHTINFDFPYELIDFTKKQFSTNEKYDLAWCIEFLEHVDEKYIKNYMPAFKSAKYIVITHALPGEPGHHHVNCQTSDYWKSIFSLYNLTYDEQLTMQVRQCSTMERDFIRRRGLVFKHNDYQL